MLWAVIIGHMRRERVIPELSASPLSQEVKAYLHETEGIYKPHQPEYFMRHALRSAREAHERGNYGIGACLLVIDGEDVAVYTGRNHMFTGSPFDRTHLHAETDAIKNMLDGKVKPLETFKTAEIKPILDTLFGPDVEMNGIVEFGTLEPCEKCEIEQTNLLAVVQERFGPNAKVASISANVDGKIERLDGGATRSTGAAHALGAKSLGRAMIWDGIQHGWDQENQNPPVRFSLLSDDRSLLQPGEFGYGVKPWEFVETNDVRLVNLCRDIFERGRVELDNALGGKKKV